MMIVRQTALTANTFVINSFCSGLARDLGIKTNILGLIVDCHYENSYNVFVVTEATTIKKITQDVGWRKQSSKFYSCKSYS